MALTDLVEKRARLWEESKAILKKAEDEKREKLTDEEGTKFDAIHAEMESLRGTIDRIQKSEAVERELGESRGRKVEPSAPSSERRVVVPAGAHDWQAGFRSWLLAGSDQRQGLSQAQVDIAHRVGLDVNAKVVNINLGADPMRRLADRDSWEYRALGVGTTGAGGFTVPNEMMRALEVALLTYGGARQVSTIIRTETGAALPIPNVNDTANVGAIVAENTTVAQQDVAFTQLVLNSFKYSSKMILVSIELAQDNAVNLASYLGDALGTRIGRIQNTHFTVGTGTAQPFGIVTQATIGKQPGTTQTTTILFDDLVDLEHSVDPSYRAGAKFMMHDSTLKAIKKLKDSQGRPLFLPGISVTNPDTILGYPFVINQDVPVMATTAKSVVFGALEKYIVRDVLGFTLMRLDERFAEFGQIAFLAFQRADGNLLNAGTNPVKVFANSA